MFANHLMLALRALRRYKGYTFINVTGLIVGIACCLLIGTFIRHELSYDRHHAYADRLYRVVEIFSENGELVEESASNPFPVGPTLADAFPDVKVARFYQTFQKDPLIGLDDRRFYEERFFFTDSTVFDLFTIPFIEGDPQTALDEPFTVVLTESAARKYFGDADPMGRALRFENAIDFTVTGIVEDPPATAHFRYDLLASLQRLDAVFEATGNVYSWESWYWNPAHTYVLLPEGMSRAAFEAELPGFIASRMPEWSQENITFYLQLVTDIHLHSRLYQEIEVNGSMTTVYVFAVIAAFILLIACINFTNLATARSMRRAREVGVRKLLGASRGQLIRQFLGEALLLSAVAGAAAVLVSHWTLPVFSRLVGRELVAGWLDGSLMPAAVVGLTLVVGLMAGLYPAFFLSAHRPVEVLKGGMTRTPRRGRLSLRSGLVVLQFGISMALIVGTIVVYRQLEYMRSKDLGFEEEQVVMVPIRGTDIRQEVETFKAEVRALPGVVNAAAMSEVLGQDVAVRPFPVEGIDTPLQVPGLSVDFDFLETFGVELLAGRGFTPGRSLDSTSFLINETLVPLTGDGAPLGKRMGFGRGYQGEIIGIVQDFNFAPLRERIRPLAIMIEPNIYAFVAVRVAPGALPGVMADLEAVWRRFEPARPFQPFFLDDHLNRMYDSETRLSRLILFFALLAIFIACLGLVGLVSFTVEQRTKEIGVRKVLGATVTSVTYLLVKDFLGLVLVAFVVAAPVAYLLMNRWLEDFAYRITLGAGVFAAAGLVSLLIGVLAVGFQALRAAHTNPAQSLRYE